ncbi:MAG: hypothetical protein RL708_1237 [Bacteroidota bacterium]|jgi:hypothetical protein
MKKIILAVIVLVQFGSNSFAQENMPYSRYGIGTLQPSQFQSTMGMGNCATTFQNEFMQNPANPASYAALASKAVTFEAAIQGRQNILNSGNSNSKYFDLNPAHVGLAAMVKSNEKFKWGMGFNLIPFSKVAYNLQQDGNKNDTPALLKHMFQANGNFYKFQFGNGIKYKNLFVGLNIGYIFGGTKSNVIAYYPDSVYTLASVYNKSQHASGLNFQAGLQYVIKLPKDQKLVLGATFTPQSVLTSTRNEAWIRINNSGTIVDTAKLNSDTSGKIILPSQLAFGIQWSQGRNWGVAAEFSESLWSNYRNFEQRDSFKNAWKISVGAFFTPDPLATQVLKRCIYKVGVNYGTDALYLRNKQFKAYSVSAGISMPVLYKAEEGRPMYMFVHANIESGVRSTTVSGLINENFFRFNLGATISGNWFQKRKFD